jgi:hypothetical protein
MFGELVQPRENPSLPRAVEEHHWEMPSTFPIYVFEVQPKARDGNRSWREVLHSGQ